ncbi:MAG: DegT/DnrJ/EryC1/StrS family aminotransferase [Solirubrobacteraceae bacterium]
MTTTAAPIPMRDLGGQYRTIKHEMDAAIHAVLDRGEFERGDELWELERQLAEACGVTRVVAVGSGLAAIFVLLRALGIGPGHEVITAPNTDIATCSAISHTGARLKWADVRLETHNLDPERVAAAIGPRTRAIVAVHLYGLPAEMDALRGLACADNLAIVEDAALAFGARIGNRPVGALGDGAAFSLAPSKVLGAYGDGGFIAIDDESLAARARLLAGYGEPYRNAMTGPDGRLRLEAEGYHSHLDLLQAAVLRVKLRHLPEWTRRRQRIAALYEREFAGSGVVTPLVPSGVTHAFRNYVVRVEERDQVRAALADRGITTALLYTPPLHLQPVYKHLERGPGAFPVAERLARELLCLPIYPELTDDDVRRVARELRRAVKATR